MFDNVTSDEEVHSRIAEQFTDKWITAYDYHKAAPMIFSGQALPEKYVEDVNFMKSVLYISELFISARDMHFEGIDEKTIHEVIQWERDGGLCIYLSVLLYSLLLHNNVADDTSLKYVQGYYRHDERKDVLFSLAKEHLGLHAWLSLDDAIVDIAIRQEELFYDFGRHPYILGKVPSGMNLVGFIETSKTPKKYARNIAKATGLTFEQWIHKHNSQALTVARKAISKD